MKNYVQPGDMITFIAAAAIASGAGVLVGSLFGVSSGSYASGAQGEMKTTGVFDLTAATAATGAVGAKAYWDDTAKNVTGSATNNSLIGVFVNAKANGETVARIRLNGVSV
jgi:predicted RecA/RadA family phage recombinase